MGIEQVNKTYSKIPFSGDLYCIEISQFIYISNQLPGFCIVWVSAEGNYRIDLN